MVLRLVGAGLLVTLNRCCWDHELFKHLGLQVTYCPVPLHWSSQCEFPSGFAIAMASALLQSLLHDRRAVAFVVLYVVERSHPCQCSWWMAFR